MPETSSFYFPKRLFQWDLVPEQIDETEVVASRGREQRRAHLPEGGRRSWTGSLIPYKLAERAEMIEFMRSMRGRLHAFNIFNPDRGYWTNKLVGTTTGVVLIYTLSYLFENGTFTGLEVDGTPVAVDDYTITQGANGEAVLTFDSAQPADKPITFDLIQAHERIVVRNLNDVQRERMRESEYFYGIRSVQVIEVL